MKIFFSFVTAIVLLDQISKQWVLLRLDSPMWFFVDGLGFQLSFNDGIAFSLPLPFPWTIILPALITLLLVSYFISYEKERLSSQVTFGLIVGGALGNLADRFFHPGVVDFIQVFSFPTFNVADSAISIGVVLVLVSALFFPSDHSNTGA